MFARGGKLFPKALALTGTVGGALAVHQYMDSRRQSSALSNEVPVVSPIDPRPSVNLPSREDLLSNLQKTDKFDVLIIGGGASGAGSALDAATRGLNVACVEANDFASGTSSKSTKMAHGGVRYLEKAVFELSRAQLDLVIEALNERGHMLETAPHLCKILPIMIPVYSYWQVPYFFAGCKLYDWFAGKQNLRSSYLLSKTYASELAPMLDESKLKAGLVYHDGSFNDSRMNSTLAISAIEHGATVLNYVKVTQLLKDSSTNKVEGAIVEDQETGKQYQVKAKVTVNATGPYSDLILQMDKNKNGLPDPQPPQPANVSIATEVAVNKPNMVVPSAGVHIILPSYYCPKTVGLLDVKTADGRVMFFLPWQGKVLAGTTDIPMKTVPQNPTATEADIQDILRELQHYIKFPVRREDVLSAWAGIRPLVMDPRKRKDTGGSTEGLVRNHLIFTSETGLITLAGGKWTTYREMAEQTIDEVVKEGGFSVKPCITRKIKLAGGENWTPNLSALLAQHYKLSQAMSQHLSNNYGTRAPIICELFKEDERNQLPVAFGGRENVTVLHHVNFDSFRYPFTIGEFLYSIRHEYSRKATDFLMRRTRYAFLDAANALTAVEGTVKVMGDELNWDSARRQREIEECTEFIKTFGV
ncbi:ZYRO0B16522p [Zygosaccharomyces rouxii]|uniref:Glycerol-3-phosphate dehydrogenase n=2 Tax=Zygosaccharomyces rouxii TaxID=4956 RepID=C5DSF8_ZYGRC|nr:uncharacterized protein ZYRO0B16522g [Zygosaccharomyces rouxii]CAR26719.1 ZYRO0B16522p [Zygosaccharomyces rouxii]